MAQLCPFSGPKRYGCIYNVIFEQIFIFVLFCVYLKGGGGVGLVGGDSQKNNIIYIIHITWNEYTRKITKIRRLHFPAPQPIADTISY